MFEFLHFDDKFPMTPLEVFIQKALMFLLRCTAIYQELQPDRATIHVVTMDGGKVQKFRYELDTATESYNFELKDFNDTITGIQVQMVEDGGKLILAGQVNAGDNCRGFVANGTDLKPEGRFDNCGSVVTYMLEKKLYFIRCKTGESLTLSYVTNLEGSPLAGEEVVDQAALPCQRDLAVSEQQKVFAFDKSGCKQVGADIKKWNATSPADCEKKQIVLTEGTESELYSLYYLSLVFQEDCPLYTALLEEHKSELMNAYVKLVKTSAGTSTIANETTDNFFENNQPAVFGSSVCAFVIFLILVGGVLLFAYKKRKLLPEEEDEE